VKHKALGKGLSALIVDRGISQDQRILFLPISKIRASSQQPRQSFDSKELSRLAQSIRQHGVILPIIVRPMNDGYEIVAGERRWRASCEAGLEKIPAIVKKIEDSQSLELALIENLQRQDLNPIEEATGYSFLIQEYDLTQEQVAERVGKDRATIANLLRLLKLPVEIKNLLLTRELTTGHAKSLLAINSKDRMIHLAMLCVRHQWPVRTLEEKIKQLHGVIKSNNQNKPAIQDPNIDSIVSSIRNRFSTKIVLKQTQKGKGYIHLEFYSPEDLSRILELLSGGE
jgi:ParB family transcriptional regulator, chromosome partitioning protein